MCRFFKKRIYLALLMILFVGCTYSDRSFELAVVKTSSVAEKSEIIYFDKDLKPIYSEKLKFAELGTSYYNPYYSEQDVFLVPRGLQGYHNTKKVISVNTSNRKIRKYDVDKTNIICLAANEQYIYTASNLDLISYLTLINKENQELKDLSFPNEYLSMIVCNDNNVYAFFTSLDSKNLYSTIRIYDINLNYITEIDISELGINQTKFLVSDEFVYFTNPYNKYDKKNNKLGILDMENQTLSTISLLIDYPNDIDIYKDKVLIASKNPNNPFDTRIVSLDIKNMKQEVNILKSTILSMKVKDNYLYVLDQEEKIKKFDIDSNFRLINTITLDDSLDSYYSTFFVSN